MAEVGSNKFVKSSDPSRTYLGTVLAPPVRTGSLKESLGLTPVPAPGFQRFVVTHSLDLANGCGGATVIDADPNNLPRSFQCAHCLQLVTAQRSVLDAHSVYIFGDESTGPGDPPDVVVYALVLFKDCNVAEAEADWIQTIKRLGLSDYPSPDTELHCRDFFQSNKSCWNSIATGDKRWWVAKQLLDCLERHRPFYAVGVADFSTYPKTMRAQGREVKTQKEHLYILAAQAAQVQLERYGFLDAQVERKVWLDPQVTPVKFWDHQRAQVGRVIQSRGLQSQTFDEKPVLLQAADLVAYLAGRAQSTAHNKSVQKARKLLTNYSIDIARGKFNPDLPLERIAIQENKLYKNVASD